MESNGDQPSNRRWFLIYSDYIVNVILECFTYQLSLSDDWKRLQCLGTSKKSILRKKSGFNSIDHRFKHEGKNNFATGSNKDSLVGE